MIRVWTGLMLALTACAVDELGDTSDTSQDINGPSAPASQFQLDRAAAPRHPTGSGGFGGNYCTATRIAPHFAVTSAHCQVAAGDLLSFYTTGPGYSSASALVTQVIARPGVTGVACFNSVSNCYDTSGKFADIVVVRLDRDVTVGEAATLEWAYPGAGANGQKVGAGNHNAANTNNNGTLLQVADSTDSSDDNDGSFNSVHDRVDKGDSGGPLYVNGHMIGTLYGEQYKPAQVKFESLHTSVAKHLDWILANIGYHWSGSPPQTNSWFDGHLLQSVLTTERGCQYACEHTTSCQAYNYIGSSCGLYTAITSTHSQSGVHSALHYGQSSGKSGTVAGYTRSDGFNAVVHVASNGNIDEFTPGATNWTVGSISGGVVNGHAPAVASKLSGYRRSDGTNAVVYRSTANQIIEIALISTGWEWNPLPAAGTPAGDPVAYVRDDGTNAVVYRATTGHIHELHLDQLGWHATDLMVASAIPVTASSDPSAYVRSDGNSSIVFRSGTSIFELFKHANKPWDWGEPSAFAAGAPAAATDPSNFFTAPSNTKPYGYTHHDGINAIVYRTSANEIWELWLDGAGWHAGGLGSNAIGNPTAYVRTDGIEAVDFRSADHFIFEIANQGPWTPANLSSWGTPWVSATSDPSVYIRNDGVNAVLYGLASSQAGELSIHIGDSAWFAGNLSASAGE
jgi:Trypsin